MAESTDDKRSFWETIGFTLKKKEQAEKTPSITLGERDDGSVTVLNRVGSAYGYTFSTDAGIYGSEGELILRYRSMANEYQLESAIEDIVNEFVSSDSNNLVSIDLDEVKNLSESSKKTIQDEFSYILKLLNFNKRGFEIVKRWYIDGRMTYLIILDDDKSKISQQGIKELKYLDARKVRKIRVVNQDRTQQGVVLSSVIDEYWMFSENGFDIKKNTISQSLPTQTVGAKIAKDSIVQVTSGIMDPDNTIVLSHLHSAIRPLNQLRGIEDAEIIYFLVRSPSRRAFYVDVGDMPMPKAEQYVKGLMDKHKNKTVYDVSTGKVNDDRRQWTMLEDYWLPRREGGRGTEIQQLEAGANLGDMNAVVSYFLQNLYKALKIPITRLDPTSGLMLGRQAEISRDEVKFTKFIERLRRRFSEIFIDLLERQLVIKGLLKIEEWEAIKDDISFEFASDNLFNEMKENEIWSGRMDLLDRIAPGGAREFISDETIYRDILKFSQDQINQEKKQLKKEALQKAQTDSEAVNAGFEGSPDEIPMKPMKPINNSPSKGPRK